jgi:hypothetical protein
MTPRESLAHEWEKEIWEKQAAHEITMKQLELAIKRADNEAKIELKKLEAKWASWLRLPSMIIKLPLYPLLGIAYIVAIAKKYEPSKRFWDLLS